MRSRALLASVLVVSIAAPACSRGGGDDDRYVLQLDGRAQVVHDGEKRSFDSGDHRLVAGDVIRMLEGEGVLELPGEPSVLVRAGLEGRDASVVRAAAAPEIVEGDAVVVAPDALRFVAGGVAIELEDGAARVQRGLGITIALYTGAAEVRSAGRSLPGGLAALRQVSVPATGLLPREPSPLLYDDAEPDPWDRAFLGDAIDLGKELDRRARGFTGQVGARTAVDAQLLRSVLPTLAADDEFNESFLGTTVRTAGEVLVGGAIALEGDRRSLRDRWTDVFSFRDDGARWGLVALDQQVKRDALLGTLTDAFGRSPLLFAVGGADSDDGVAPGPSTSAPPPSSPPTTPSDDGDDGDGGDGGDGGDDTDPTVPPTTVPKLPPLLPEDDEPPDDERDVFDVVREVLDDLIGGDPRVSP